MLLILKKSPYCAVSSGALPTLMISLSNGFLYEGVLIAFHLTPEIYFNAFIVDIPAMSVSAISTSSKKFS